MLLAASLPSFVATPFSGMFVSGPFMLEAEQRGGVSYHRLFGETPSIIVSDSYCFNMSYSVQVVCTHRL